MAPKTQKRTPVKSSPAVPSKKKMFRVECIDQKTAEGLIRVKDMLQKNPKATGILIFTSPDPGHYHDIPELHVNLADGPEGLVEKPQPHAYGMAMPPAGKEQRSLGDATREVLQRIRCVKTLSLELKELLDKKVNGTYPEEKKNEGEDYMPDGLSRTTECSNETLDFIEDLLRNTIGMVQGSL